MNKKNKAIEGEIDKSILDLLVEAYPWSKIDFSNYSDFQGNLIEKNI